MEELQASPDKFKHLREEMRELCKTNLYFLLKAGLGYDQLTPRLHWPMCQFIQSPPGLFYMLMAFRGSFKSTIGTIGKTVQEQLKKPTDILIFSEAGLMAESWSREARAPFEGQNKFMAWLYPELMGGQKTSAKWGDGMWQLPHGGKVYAAGIDAGTMGIHVDGLLMDDIFSDPKSDKSPEYADRVLQFIKMSAPLLKNPAKNWRGLTGVPWWMQGEPYAHYRKTLPRKCQFVLPLMDSSGECIWPERFSPENIDELRADPFVFASQYLLNPVSQETAIFKKGCVHVYDDKPEFRNYTRIMSYDPAYSKDTRAHHNAYAIADVDSKGGIWIETVEKRKLESHEAKRWCIETAIKNNVMFLGLEANGPQKLFFEDVRNMLLKYPIYHAARKIVLVKLLPIRDKVSRWNQLASGCGTGQVKFKSNNRAVIAEMYRVTGAKHEENDMTDACAHLVGPELSKKKPMRFSELQDDHMMHYALREDLEVEERSSWMAA